MNQNHRNLIRDYQQVLQAAATEQTKQWWERYMKGVISFRGVGIPANRELLKQWRTASNIDRWPVEEQLDLALAFFGEPLAEDKLAGILFIQNYLYKRLPWEIMLTRFEEIYRHKLIFDWNICDWFCVRVLGPMIRENGPVCARKLLSWKDAPYLWQARSSLVPFITVAHDSRYYPLIREACGVLIRREERFAKTAVGWVLRDISKHDTIFTQSFVREYISFFSRESLDNALKYFDKEFRNIYRKQLS